MALTDAFADLAGNVAFEAMDDLSLALVLGSRSVDIIQCRLASAHADNDDAVFRCNGLPIATTVEVVSIGLAAKDRDRTSLHLGGELADVSSPPGCSGSGSFDA